MKFKDWNILLEQGEIQIYLEDNFATLDFISKSNSSAGMQQFHCNNLGDAVSYNETLVKGDLAC